MRMPDVNVLLGAFRQDAVGHEALRDWLEAEVRSGRPVGLSPAVITGTVRLLTNHRIFAKPDSIQTALSHIDQLLAQPGVIVAGPGPRHWQIFAGLCADADARGNLVSDAAHAAVAIEHGARWVTLDRDFARFPGLVWEAPSLNR